MTFTIPDNPGGLRFCHLGWKKQKLFFKTAELNRSILSQGMRYIPTGYPKNKFGGCTTVGYFFFDTAAKAGSDSVELRDCGNIICKEKTARTREQPERTRSKRPCCAASSYTRRLSVSPRLSCTGSGVPRRCWTQRPCPALGRTPGQGRAGRVSASSPRSLPAGPLWWDSGGTAARGVPVLGAVSLRAGAGSGLHPPSIAIPSLPARRRWAPGGGACR